MATVLYCLCRLYFSINKTNWMEIIMAHQNDISWHQFDTTEMSIDARRRHHERDSLENKHYDNIKIRSENCQCMITRKPKRSWCEYERNGFFSNLSEIFKRLNPIKKMGFSSFSLAKIPPTHSECDSTLYSPWTYYILPSDGTKSD